MRKLLVRAIEEVATPQRYGDSIREDETAQVLKLGRTS